MSGTQWAAQPCRSCGNMIRWVQTTTGKPMPVDMGRDPSGTLLLVPVRKADGSRDWRVRVITLDETVPAGAPRFTPHWATCPQADDHRKPRRPGISEGVTTGPCVRCRQPCHRYGHGGQPLCRDCRPPSSVDG